MRKRKNLPWVVLLLLLCGLLCLRLSIGRAYRFEPPAICVQIGFAKWLYISSDGVYFVEEARSSWWSGSGSKRKQYIMHQVVSW